MRRGLGRAAEHCAALVHRAVVGPTQMSASDKHREGQVMCWFLDAGNNETLRTLSEPASKKRQGTKSREVGHRPRSECYGDLMPAPTSMIDVALAEFGLRI